MSILLDKTNRVIVQGVTGQMGQFFVEDARKYGTNMVAGVSPGRAGTTVGDVPVFASVRAAVDATRADTAMVFVPPAAVLGAVLEALECGCKLVVATADEMPVSDAIEVRAAARANGAVFVGPNTPGLISPGKAKMGFMPSFCYTQGNVGVISRSGSLSVPRAQTHYDSRHRAVDGDRHRRRSGQRHHRGGSARTLSPGSGYACRVVPRRDRRLGRNFRRRLRIA